MTEPKRSESLISGAIEAVGEQRGDDYVLAPAAHAEEFAARAPLLSTILRAEPIRIAAAEYEELDAKALKAQARFKTRASRANLGVFLATCFAAGVLVMGNLAPALPSSLSNAAFVALGIASALAAALSAKWLHEIRVGKLLQKWMTARSAAETQRLRYFDLAIERSYADSSDEPGLTALLQLEYFRRFQLAVQLAFLRERGSDHERAADQTLRLGGTAVGIASLVTCVAGILGAVDPPLASFAALGVMGAALAGFANTRDAISQDRRNAERYGRTADALKGLCAKLPRVRQATARGSRETLGQFAEAVHEQLSTEHRQWIDAAESTSAAMARLDQTLSAVEDQCGTQ